MPFTSMAVAMWTVKRPVITFYMLLYCQISRVHSNEHLHTQKHTLLACSVVNVIRKKPQQSAVVVRIGNLDFVLSTRVFVHLGFSHCNGDRSLCSSAHIFTSAPIFAGTLAISDATNVSRRSTRFACRSFCSLIRPTTAATTVDHRRQQQ